MALLLTLLLGLFSGQILALMLAETVKHLWLLTISPDVPAFHVLYGVAVIVGLVFSLSTNGLARDPEVTKNLKTGGDHLIRMITLLLATGIGCLLVIGLTKLTTVLFL